MSFVLDNSVTMRWFFGDGKHQEVVYAGKVLDALKNSSAVVPVTWGAGSGKRPRQGRSPEYSDRSSKRHLSQDA